MVKYRNITSCRSCDNETLIEVFNLGSQPLANDLLANKNDENELFPLTLVWCPKCTLLQTRETVNPEILFRNYVYLSSQSSTMIESVKKCAQSIIIDEKLGKDSLVVELASNDGYLLQHYKDAGINICGVDPARNIADIANKKGIPTEAEFFTLEYSEEFKNKFGQADVIHANNVLAHVADTKGFVKGIANVIKDTGVVVIEVPYVGKMIEHVEFDTIYHEHLCYFSFMSIDKLLSSVGLKIFKIESLQIHGGSMRVFARKNAPYFIDGSIAEYFLKEKEAKFDLKSAYFDFADKVQNMVDAFWNKVNEFDRSSVICAYGATAKGSTLLNFHSEKRNPEAIRFIMDNSPTKQGKFSPGCKISIIDPDTGYSKNPKECILLAWNFASEIVSKEKRMVEKGCRFWIPDKNDGLKIFGE